MSSGFGSIRAKVSEAVADRRYDEALAVAALLAAEHPSEPEAHMALSDSFSHLARYEEAIQAATRAIALDADRVGSIAHRGRLHLKAEQFDAARADFEQAVATGERVGISYFRSDALLHLAIALEQLGTAASTRLWR